MNSHDHPSAYGYQPPGGQEPTRPWQPVHEDTLQSWELPIERKTFIFTLKENPRGRFLRITELRQPRSAAIIVPASGLKDFQKLLADMVKAESELPAKPEAMR
jgi:hypothetical protein